MYVEHQYYVSVRGNSFRFANLVTKEEHFVPLDEIEWLIFNNEKSYFTKRLVTVCMEKGIGILFCDLKHNPGCLLSTSYGHSQRVTRLRTQLALQKKTKNRLWRKIVIAKINNQADCLAEALHKEDATKKIRSIGKTVVEGDPHNREAYAARIYFINLFGAGFRRGRFDDAVNASLNYGYALVRALIRRELALHGLEASLGIKHESVENPFNLSDDIIEAYRPFVDAMVYEKIYDKKIISLELEEKKQLLQVFMEKCVIDNKVFTINDAVSVTVESYIKCIEENSAAPLKLPMFIEGGK
ncbi:type II CRISPR-associated endonuclease Cas1 [Jeotgalibaca ciconiae]|uniref:type II CRISPR-associated endonuclease Cas1 n=1 Tax=Jeotgalibaca ciconiae TaxID=2496265 RepID=UPI001D131362|nr:type II CRISPR-associated endonuclease Cas1 [Jeotgalibaca ciconiae]